MLSMYRGFSWVSFPSLLESPCRFNNNNNEIFIKRSTPHVETPQISGNRHHSDCQQLKSEEAKLPRPE